ncbi:MAG: hypothetical protein QM820_26250 [Minicystis sp.]
MWKVSWACCPLPASKQEPCQSPVSASATAAGSSGDGVDDELQAGTIESARTRAKRFMFVTSEMPEP